MSAEFGGRSGRQGRLSQWLRGRRPMMVSGAHLHSIPAGYWFDLRARALIHEEGSNTSAREASE